MVNPCMSGLVSEGMSTGIETIYAVRGKFPLLSPTTLHLTWVKVYLTAFTYLVSQFA